MKKEVLVTGGNGKIAKIIAQLLGGEFSFTFVDVAKDEDCPYVQMLDVANDYDGLVKAMKGKDVAVNLAWHIRTNWRIPVMEQVNVEMAKNVYFAAMEAGVKRVVMPSSVHVHDFDSWNRLGFLCTDEVPKPVIFYGAENIFIESMGRCFSALGLEVVCPRLGSVESYYKSRKEKNYEKIWLSKRDCASLIGACIKAPSEIIQDKFCGFYGISDNSDRVHDWKNRLLWEPKDDSSKIAI